MRESKYQKASKIILTNRPVFVFLITLASTLSLQADNLLTSSYDFDIHFSEAAKTVYIHQTVTIYNNSKMALDTLFMHVSPNAYTSPKSHFYQEDENYLNEPLGLNIQSLSVSGNPCGYSFESLTSMAVVLNRPLGSNDSARISFDYTITIPEGNHPTCPSYSGSNFRLLNFYPKPEQLSTTGWTPGRYRKIEPSSIKPANHTLRITLPKNYAVVSSLESTSQIDTLDNETIHRFQSAKIRDLGIVFSANQVVIPFRHFGINVQLMLPGIVERRFRLSNNTIFQNITKRILEYYSDHIINYPCNHLSVASSNIQYGVVSSNLIILKSGDIENITNLEYRSVYFYAQSIADQYFHYYIYEYPDSSDWINTGLAGYMANEFMITQYQSLTKASRLQHPENTNTADKILRLAALAADQEKIGRSLKIPLGPSNTPFLVDQIQHYKSQKVLKMIHYYVGNSTFRKSLLELLDTYRYKPTSSRDFLQILENNSGKDLAAFNELWINSENIPDQKILQVKRSFNRDSKQYKTTIITTGDALKVMPVEIEAFSDVDTVRAMTRIQSSGRDTLVLFSRNPFRKITLDPNRNIWEFNRLNNNYPSKILFNFLIAMPNIDAYQVFYYPTFDFNERDLGRIGLKLRGRYWINMRPLFPSQSLDEWTLGLNYGLRSETLGYDVSYSTSILALFFQPRIHIRSRSYFGLHESSLKSEFYIGKINYPLIHRIQGYKKLNVGVRFQDVRTLEFLNENNWQTGKLLNPFAELINFHNWGDFRHITRLYFGIGIPKLDTDYSYQKLIFDTQVKYRPGYNLWLYQRIFAGFSRDQLPIQNYFYFFGKNTLENMSFESFRLIKGAGDMRGYGAASPKGRNILTSNTEFRWSYATIEPAFFDLILFIDSGLISSSAKRINTRQLKYDAGIGTEFNALETITIGVHIPFWVSHPVDDKPQFDLRWVLAVDMTL